MNFKKRIDKITSKLIAINNCDNAEEFYQLCTGLYYQINSIVFKLEHDKFNMGESENVPNNRTNSN